MRQSLLDASALTRRSFITAGACAGVASLGLLAGCASQEAPSAETAAPDDGASAEPPAPAAADAGDLPATGGEDVVYIVDRLTSKPGGGKELYDGYMSTIKPMIENGGWTFVRATIAPAMWIDTDSNIIEIVWTMPDIAVGAWGVTGATRAQPEWLQWWSEAHKKAEAIDRVYSASETYMEVLNNV